MSRAACIALLGVMWTAACSPIVVVESGSGGAGYGGSSLGGADAGAEAGGGQGGQAKPPGCVPCSNIGALPNWDLSGACPGSLELANAVWQCGCEQCGPTCPEVCPYGMSFDDSQTKCYNCFNKDTWWDACQEHRQACMDDI